MLYIVPTPIGNLKDITFRAIDTLKNVDLILAEDTRIARKLLTHFAIENKIEAFHKFNEHQKLSHYINLLKSGKNIALISDAGTPGISDPGFLIVRQAINEKIEVQTLPGATAFVPALVNSGIPCDRFCFEGFLPPKKGRKKRLQTLAETEKTLIFYESPHKLLKTLQDFIEYFGANRQASVSREISKIYEQTIRGTLKEVLNYFKNNTIKGEFVIIIEGKKKNNSK